MAKADMPDFTVREAELIAGLVVGRYDALVMLRDSPYMDAAWHDPKALDKAIKALEPIAEKLRPWFEEKRAERSE